MLNIVDRDTVLCLSLAARPSNHGVRFHNWLFDHYDLNCCYHAIAPSDITAAIAGVRGFNVRGAAVSMPYKQDVIHLIDALDPSAARIEAVNTIVNDEGVLTGYNTDYLAVAQLLRSHGVDANWHTVVHGSGGMANAVVAACADYGLRGTIVARNASTGSALAQRYGWTYSSDAPTQADLLINVTPIGMAGDDAHSHRLAFNEHLIEQANVVFDVVAMPIDTPLIRMARSFGIPTIHGGEVLALQAAEQFKLYTGITPTQEAVDAAEAYAQQGPGQALHQPREA